MLKRRQLIDDKEEDMLDRVRNYEQNKYEEQLKLDEERK